MKCKVISLGGDSERVIDLADEVFGVAVRTDIVRRVINWQLAKRRRGTHKTKSIGEVRGSRNKPFRQKGTGRARQGSRRSPHMRGGSVVFGPVVRSHEIGLPKRLRKLGMKMALSAKQAEGKLKVLDEAKLELPKTKSLATDMARLSIQSALIIEGREVDENFARAVSNLQGIDLLPQQGANVYDILHCDVLVLTQDAVRCLEERLK